MMADVHLHSDCTRHSLLLSNAALACMQQWGASLATLLRVHLRMLCIIIAFQ